MADQKTNKPAPAPTPPVMTLLPLLVEYFKSLGLLLLVFFVGYFNFSIVWIIVALALHLARKKYQKEKQAKIDMLHEAAKDEKKSILARVQDLPSWVYFPDVERAEWLNKIVKQMWPFVGDYVRQILLTSVEPKVRESMPDSFKSFKFERIDLGDIAPRFGGVKVYTQHVRRDEIVMDMELFYASDADIRVAIKYMSAGIKDLQIHGTLRVIMKPLINKVPMIGGITVFFLNQPHIDFNLTNVANALDAPLLSDGIRSTIEDYISAFMVLPNRLKIPLIENLDVDSFKYPQPQGVLRIHLIGARDLEARDWKIVGKGRSDPYTVLRVGAQSFKTKVIQDSVNPAWNQYFEAIVDQRFGQYVELDVFDEDPGTKDDELGNASVDINSVADKGEFDSWLPLENVKQGMIHLRLTWHHLASDPKELTRSLSQVGRLETEEALSSAMLMVHLDSAQNLPRSKKSMSEPSPMVKLFVGSDVKKSQIQKSSNSPVWEENFQYLIHNPELESFSLEVIDKKSGKKLGTLTFPLKQLLTATNMTINRPFPLKESSFDAKIRLRLCLRIMTTQAPPVSEAPPPPVTTTTTETPGGEEEKLAPEPEEEPAQPDSRSMGSTDSNGFSERAVDVDSSTDSSDLRKRTTAQDDPESAPAVAPPVVAPPELPRSELASYEEAEPPVEEVMPSAEPESAVMERSGEELRNRAAQPPSDVSPFGRIQMTLRYSVQRSKLIIVIHKCMNLPALDHDGYSDPYVRIYLLPKSSGSKQKTQVVKNNLNPIYDETFEYSISQMDVSQKTLDVCVKNNISLFSKDKKKEIGKVEIDLSEYDLTKAHTEWYELQDPDDTPAGSRESSVS